MTQVFVVLVLPLHRVQVVHYFRLSDRNQHFILSRGSWLKHCIPETEACCWRKGRWEGVKTSSFRTCRRCRVPDHILYVVVWEQPDHILYVVVWEQPDHILYVVVWEQPGHILYVVVWEQPGHILYVVVWEHLSHMSDILSVRVNDIYSTRPCKR